MQLRAFSNPTSPFERLDSASAQMVFQHGFVQAQARVSNVWEAETVLRRNKAMQELGTWLKQLPADWGKSLLTCTPADLVVCLESHWLSQHASTTLPNGSIIASPSGVSQCLSNCSTGFKLIGRVGNWNPLDSSGDPVGSTLITQSARATDWKPGEQATVGRFSSAHAR